MWNALAKLNISAPAACLDVLASDAATIAAANLRSAVECRDLLHAFAEKDLSPPMFLKGLAIGRLAYSDPFAKLAWDIDILVAPADLEDAADLLEANGYRLRLPSARSKLTNWHGPEKESIWRKDSAGLYVELHTRVSENRRLIPSISASSPRQQVDVAPGIVLPTFADDALFSYLAVHGSSSAWFRLKWISDFAGFLDGRTATELDRFYRRSRGLGAGRAVGQALLLADALFGSLEAVPDLRRTLQSDRWARLLYRAALKQLTGPPREPTGHRFGTLRIHWTQLLIMPGLRFQASELWRQARKALRQR